MSIRVICIKKSAGYHADPHHAISELSWVEDGTGRKGKSTRLEIYNWIKNQSGVAYVVDAWNRRAQVGTRENTNGTKFLQTYSDRVWTDNLLALPECIG